MSSDTVEILSPEAMRRTMTRLASEIIEQTKALHTLALLGIHTRGVPMANLLAQQITALEGISVPVGALDITLYRDDLNQIKLRTPAKTTIDFDLSGKSLVLVDDVIHKGRTIRAALNAVTDYGRPTLVRLAVLIDRIGHRELPIQPDYSGKTLPTSKDEDIRVNLQAVDGRDGVELIKRA
ncbi:MAG: bifunctional pyr operon transcriptional regulator/uracil phosphoribosyltransferase PyrR [Cyanobacteria bacterium P01_A01_bin.135]